MPQISLSFATLVSITISGLLFLAAHAVRTFYFNPLKKYPGPRLAAFTYWYRAYYDIVKDGGWVEHLFVLHEKYGTIVRVGPNELHFSDPRAYNDIYGIGTRFSKQHEMYSSFATDRSVFSLHNHQEAMTRRAAMGPFFSRKAILNLEHVIQAKINHLISILLKDYSLNPNSDSQTPKPADLDLAFRCLTLDIIATYSFAKSTLTLDSPNFKHPVMQALDNTLPTIWILKHFPLMRKVILNVPDWLAGYLDPSTIGILEQKKMMGKQIDDILNDPASLCGGDHETIFHHFLNPNEDDYPWEREDVNTNTNGTQTQTQNGESIPNNQNHESPEKPKSRLPPLSRDWLLDEGLYLQFAGSDTVGNPCTVAFYHILTNPNVHKTLLNELVQAWPDIEVDVKYERLEKLPYLTAVIKESLRVGPGVVSPLPRLVGPTDAEILGTSIPAGTVVSMASPILHSNPDIFPDPDTFLPERWMNDNQDQTLDKYLVAFSKGPRSCLGINLAWCELYLIIANIIRKLELIPDNACIENIKYREYFIPIHRGRHLHAFVKQRDT